MQEPLPQDVIPISVQTGPPSRLSVQVQLEHLMKGAFSESTERAMESDLAIYTGWCADHGLDALPALPATIAAFVDSMARTRSPLCIHASFWGASSAIMLSISLR